MTASSAAHLERLVAERHKLVCQRLEHLIDAFASLDQGRLQGENTALLKALQALADVVASQDHPAWLSTLINHATHFEANHDQGFAAAKPLLATLMNQYPAAVAHQWFAADEQSPDFDVDAIIAAAKAHHKIDELYEKLIAVLERLTQCEELDSVKATEDLNRVIAMLKRAKNGTLMSQVLSWQFARRFVPNLIAAYLKRSDITGPAIEAFEQTATELDVALDATKDEIGEKLLEAAKRTFKSNAIGKVRAEQIEALPKLGEEDATE